MFEYALDDDLKLRTLQLEDAQELFTVIDRNREHLREWLPWLDANRRGSSGMPNGYTTTT